MECNNKFIFFIGIITMLYHSIQQSESGQWWNVKYFCDVLYNIWLGVYKHIQY